MFGSANVRTPIDSLHANVAVLDSAGRIVQVNEGWRRFGARRNAQFDYVGLNYLQVCENAVAAGDASAKRVETGLCLLLHGRADTFGTAYHCGDRTFRLSARHVSQPAGGVVVAHQDITTLLAARRSAKESREELNVVQKHHVNRVESVHEELGQRLTAISLAAAALEHGGNVEDAITLIEFAVEEARQELKLLRYEARQQ
jgi:hypothetical protein